MKLVFFVILWFLISLALPREFDAHNPYDQSWMSVLSSGGDYVFTYGPLSWVFLPDLNGISLSKIFLRFVFFCFLLIPFWKKMCSLKDSPIKILVVFFGLLLLLTGPYFKFDMYFYLSYWLILQEIEENEQYDPYMLAGWSLIAPLYKFSFFPLAVFMCLYAFSRFRNFRKVIICNLLLILLLQTLIDSHFLARLDLSLGYSEYMAAYQDGTAVMTILMLLLSGVVIWSVFPRVSKFRYFILLLSLFIQFKHASILGTPGYSFYLFFLPFSFFLWMHPKRLLQCLSVFCLWMIPSFINYVGGYSGLLEKLFNSLIFRSNISVVVDRPLKCKDGKRLLMLDHFQDAIGSPCEIEAFPSIQFYGISPNSLVAGLNSNYLKSKQPANIYFSLATFGQRSPVSELSYLLKDLLKNYDLTLRPRLSVLVRKASPLDLKMECHPRNHTSKLVYLKMKCAAKWSFAYHNIMSFIYKAPEYRLHYGNGSERVFLTSLRNGVYSYLGPADEIHIWWNNLSKLPLYTQKPVTIQVLNGGGLFSRSIEEEVNHCLVVSYCHPTRGN
jgi:hypothetical protein